jgi:hypothetical protein
MFFSIDGIYNLLRDSLYSVQNEQFIGTFKDQFVREILTDNKDHLKDIQSYQNPLFRLISINRPEDRKNTLLKDLIGLATSLIDISEEEVLNDTFYHPSTQTFTYAVLFNKSLNLYPISKKVISHLNAQWKNWTPVGVRANDVWTWRGLSKGEQSVVRQIWALATQNSKEKYFIDKLFDATDQKMQTLL